MAKFNYYQHNARRFAKSRYPNNEEQRTACERGYIEGFECALRSLSGTTLEHNPDVKIWIDVWTTILTDESEWDY